MFSLAAFDNNGHYRGDFEDPIHEQLRPVFDLSVHSIPSMPIRFIRRCCPLVNAEHVGNTAGIPHLLSTDAIVLADNITNATITWNAMFYTLSTSPRLELPR